MGDTTGDARASGAIESTLRRRLGVRIGIALLLVATLSGLSYLGLLQLVSSQQTDAPTINVSGRQRMLSQRVSLLALRYVSTGDPAERERLGTLLDDAIALMADSHDALVHGREAMGIAAEASPEVGELYHGDPRLDLRVADYLGWAERVRRLPARELGPDHPLIVRLLAESERPLLRDLNQAVGLYEAESSAHVTELERVQLGLFLATLALLGVEALVIFWPLVQSIVGQVQQIRSREQALRLVLDSTEDGLLVVDEAGRVQDGWSARVEAWFGNVTPGEPFWTLLFDDPVEQERAEIAFEQLTDGWLPEAVALHQLPREIRRGKCVKRLGWQRVDGGGSWLLSIVDVTDNLAAAEAERRREEFHEVLAHVLRGRGAFLCFRDEVDRLFDSADQLLGSGAPDAAVVLGRVLHTIKGNCSIFGFRSVAAMVHDLETARADGVSDLRDGLDAIRSQWQSDLAQLAPYLVGGETQVVLSTSEIADHLDHLRRGVAHPDLLGEVRRWLDEPVRGQLEHLAASTKRIAERLDKPVDVVVESNGTRMPPGRLASFWSSLVHVVRNAVDHGIEPPEARGDKPPVGTIELSCFVVDDLVHVTVRDDGPGIDWDRLRAKAEADGRGFDPDDPTSLIFEDGLSSRDEATALSGRGVGMSAVRAAVDALGGTIEVMTRPGRGTCLHFSLPVPVREPTPLGAQRIAEPAPA